MKRFLTLMNKLTTMVLTGETETGSVEVQPARDIRFKATNCRGDGDLLPSHFTNFDDNSELCYALKKPDKTAPPKAATLLAEGS